MTDINTDTIYFRNLNTSIDHANKQLFMIRLIDILKTFKEELPPSGYIYSNRHYWFSYEDVQYISRFLPKKSLKYSLRGDSYTFILCWGNYEDNKDFRNKYPNIELNPVYYSFKSIIKNL